MYFNLRAVFFLKICTDKVSGSFLWSIIDLENNDVIQLRQVDEGIEAMLCCWLQQLQEFGGPEVDKPDLLQNSGGASARTPLHTGSTPNLAKQVIVDPRVRYKVSSRFGFNYFNVKLITIL